MIKQKINKLEEKNRIIRKLNNKYESILHLTFNL